MRINIPDAESSSSSSSQDLPKFTTGHCSCGRSRYRVDLTNLSSDLRLTAYCHCSRCARLNGAPFIWTTHWAQEAVTWLNQEGEVPPSSKGSDSTSPRSRGGARLIPVDEANPDVPQATYAPSMAVYETMKGRKWKQRCDHCGTPLGSWNQAKGQWSLWPSTLTRDFKSSVPSDLSNVEISQDDQYHVHPAILKAIAPTDHMFYGPWRMADVEDASIPKWLGYPNASVRTG